jgi:hypothetical protein
MSDQQRPASGYRGALPPARDRLATPWVVVVIGLFVLMFVLAFLGFPSRLIPEPTPFPIASPGASGPLPSVPVSSGAPSSGAPSASPGG